MKFTRSEIERIDERMEDVQKLHCEKYSEAYVVYDPQTKDYEVYVSFDTYVKGKRPVAIH